MSGETSESSVFISYAHPDAKKAEEFASGLRSAGVRVWMDSELAAGERWRDRIAHELRHAPTIIFLLTSHSCNSSWMYFEIGAAIAGKKRILPVLLDDLDVTAIHPPLRQYKWIREGDPSIAAEIVAEQLAAVAS